MAKAPRRKLASVPLEIEIRNFGPISRGKFRLKPLTVFVGPNNSGKTFAATLAHSVISSRGTYEYPADYVGWVKRELKRQEFRSLVSGMEKLIAGASTAETMIPSKYTNAVQDIVHQHSFEKSLPGTIAGNFGTSLKKLIRIGQQSAMIKAKYHIGANIKIDAINPPAIEMGHIDVTYAIKRHQGEVSIYETSEKIFGKPVNSMFIDKNVQEYMNLISRPLKLQKKSGLYWLLHLMKRIEHARMYLPRSYHLPATRSGILSARSPIVSSIIKNSGYAAAKLPHDPMPGASYEYLDSLVQLGTYAQFTNGKNGQEMFKEMFGGKLEVQIPKIGLPQIVYRLKGTAIPLNLMSSSITETAPLQLFQQGKMPHADVLVLEEPEAHLHPENQARLAKHIVRLVNSGVCVLLITHGVYFLEQLSMFVRMSRVAAEERKDLGYAKGDFLEADDVAPYLFKKNGSGGYAIQAIEHTPDDGISQDEFGRVTEIMYNKEIRIERLISES
ncbi:MAG: AAA family ATPase [Thaumarchaeota archaeon]|nr:AAA family ATPase [Nitrososphaerota archaeon]MDD9813190.1 AAA family ATPase [Nitrososphaerota archaeon]MDD9825687.1 AAA family ATPase [Nitrososphaerota archaeon]RNJ72597.1 MAG: hypothetical protein EB833_04540 [Thaumarchaeota archaeon S13]